MPSLLSDQDRFDYTGQLYNHFLTFAQEIIVNKEPIKSFNSVNTYVLPGYSNNSDISQNVIYTDVSQSFSGLFVNVKSPKNTYIEEIHTFNTQSEFYIKVEKDCRDYIVRGKTSNITVDDMQFSVSLDYRPRDYLGLKYYQFNLQRTY